MHNTGILTVFSGFSGSGKGTVMKRLLEKYPEQYALSVSCTSRKPRTGEQDGREYFFKSREEFERLIADGQFLEYARYVDHYYGTPAGYVQQQLDAGKDVILEIELQGAMQIRAKRSDAMLIFLTPPSAAELERRLRGRGTETDEVIRARLRRAAQEAEGMTQYDYLIVNDDLEACVEQVHRLIQSQHTRMENRKAFAEQISREVRRFAE